jgi:hypothetical protein
MQGRYACHGLLEHALIRLTARGRDVPFRINGVRARDARNPLGVRMSLHNETYRLSVDEM